MKKSTIFISSVQKELQPARRAIKDYVQGDPLLRRFFEVFLFEDLPASDRRADDVYLERQRRAIKYAKEHGAITNTDYQVLVSVSKRTAYRDLVDLVSKEVFRKVGITGKGTRYVMAKGATKGPKGPSKSTHKGARKGPKGP